ncbi:transketolase [Clostridia bacterium]|nr:transketolase [Clostridia bacterium]
MRNRLFDLIYAHAVQDRNIVLIIGDLGYSCIERFAENIPNQFINAGVAEQNMASVAAGLAKRGKKVFVYSLCNFPSLRCLEQIRNDCAYHRLDVTFISNGAGFEYGSLGMSHHATEDLAAIRALPGVSVFSPADKNELEMVFRRSIIDARETAYLRINKSAVAFETAALNEYVPGAPLLYYGGGRILICGIGTIIFEAVAARNELLRNRIDCGIATFPCVKPIDTVKTAEILSGYDTVISLEEHNLAGGFGSALAEVICDAGIGTRLIRMGLQDTYVSTVGSQAYLRKAYNLSARDIIRIVTENAVLPERRDSI